MSHENDDLNVDNDNFEQEEEKTLSIWERYNNLPEEPEADPEGEADPVEQKESDIDDQEADLQGDDDPNPQSSPEPEEEPENPESAPSKEEEDPKEKERFQYWQSKYTKLQNDYKELEQRQQAVAGVDKDALEIAQLIVRNPKVLDAVQAVTSGKPLPNSSQPITVQKPERPQRPANYSAYEAVNDPDSESAKYNLSLQEYQIQRAEYDDYREEQQRAEYEKKLNQERQSQQAAARQKELVNDLQFKHNLQEEDIKDFTEFINQAPSLDTLVALWRINRGKSGSQKDLEQKAQLLKAKQEQRKKNPPPPSGGNPPKREPKRNVWGDRI